MNDLCPGSARCL